MKTERSRDLLPLWYKVRSLFKRALGTIWNTHTYPTLDEGNRALVRFLLMLLLMIWIARSIYLSEILWGCRSTRVLLSDDIAVESSCLTELRMRLTDVDHVIGWETIQLIYYVDKPTLWVNAYNCSKYEILSINPHRLFKRDASHLKLHLRVERGEGRVNIGE